MPKPAKTDLWYPFFVGDYRKDTARLSCEQHGAYRQLLDEYWITGPLPDDDEILARIVGLELRVWRRHRPHIERFFSVAAGEWRHGRVDHELEAASARREKAVAKARAAAEARWTRGGSSEDAESNAPSMPEAPSRPVEPDPARPRNVGSRLKADWQPRSEDVVYAVELGFSEPEVTRIVEDFRDYWLAKSGKDATKLDWPATWRRWVRTAAERKPHTRRPHEQPAHVNERLANRQADGARSLAGAAAAAGQRWKP